MLHHVSVGVRDVTRAAQFYDSVLGALGYKRVMEVLPYGIAYGETTPVFWVQLPHDHGAASVGNGVHVGFIGRSKEVIATFHRAALAAGGADEGAPGPRPDYGPDYFGAFVRDLDGNKLEAVLVAAPAAKRAAPPMKKRAAKKKPAKKKAAKKKSKRAASKKSPKKAAAQGKRAKRKRK